MPTNYIRDPKPVKGQQHMFPAGDELPLFSGVAQVDHSQPFNPQRAEQRQPKLSACPVCLDSGVLRSNGHTVYCECPAGQRTRDQLQADGKRLQRIKRNLVNAYPDETARALREVASIEPIGARATALGVNVLSTVELISLLLGEKVPTLAITLLARYRSLPAILKAHTAELAQIKGMTARRATQLQAAIQLATRFADPMTEEERPMIKSPADAASILAPYLAGLDHEKLWVLALNTKNRLIAKEMVYRGSVHSTVIRIGELLRPVLLHNAPAMIVVHNHPSTDPTPSPEDVAVNEGIYKAAKDLDVDLLDHLVFGSPTRFVSLKEHNMGFG